MFGDQEDVIFEIGNTHKDVAKPKLSHDGVHYNTDEWTAFVRVVGLHKGKEHKLIDNVKFQLHSTAIV